MRDICSRLIRRIVAPRIRPRCAPNVKLAIYSQGPKGRTDELDREVRAHLALLADDYENRGLSPAKARTAARRARGGVEQTKELHRDQRGFPLLNSVWQDLHYAGRTLSQAPGFSLSVIASLSIGMAAVVAAFAFINGVMFHPYPGIDERDRLVEIQMQRGTRVPGYWSANRIAMSEYPENYRILRDGFRSLENLASYVAGDVSAILPQRSVLRSALVSANYFDALGVGPEIGRFFVPEEDELANAYVAVIGHDLWVREFGGDPGAIGRLIQVADQNVEIVGVAPEGFAGAGYSFGRPGYEVWLPIPLTELVLKDVPSVVRGQQPGDREIQYIGRMKDGVEVPLVQAELDVVAPQTATIGFRPGPVMGEASILSMIHPSDGALLTALILSIPILVLIIGCINAANLLLARASRRDREMAIRLAVGASRWRLIRQLIVESLVLALGAAAVALPLAWWGLQFATPFLLVPMPLDAAVLAAALGTRRGNCYRLRAHTRASGHNPPPGGPTQRIACGHRAGAWTIAWTPGVGGGAGGAFLGPAGHRNATGVGPHGRGWNRRHRFGSLADGVLRSGATQVFECGSRCVLRTAPRPRFDAPWRRGRRTCSPYDALEVRSAAAWV